MNLRKLKLINPHFQLRFLAFMLLLATLVLVLVYLAHLAFFARYYEIGQAFHLEEDEVFFQFLEQQKHSMNLIFLALSGVITLFLTVAGYVFSHRVAGPIYKLKRQLQKNAQTGVYERVRFRKRDFFHDLAVAYNNQLPKAESKENEPFTGF